MTIVERAATAVDALRALFGDRYRDYAMLAQISQGRDVEDVVGMYEVLSDLYFNDRVELSGEQTIPGYRNPTQAAVEFYVATVWPGALPEALPIDPGEDVENPDALIAAIHQIWEWSNWSVNKQEHVRNTAMLGDGLLKVATSVDRMGRVNRVFIQSIDPASLTDFEVDERGYFTYLRLDTEVAELDRETGERTDVVITEVWDKERGTMRRWQHEQGTRATLPDLGEPDEERLIVKMTGDDFIPFSHIKHRAVRQQPRGVAAITPALVKALHGNRLAVRMEDLLFQFGRPDLVLQSSLTDEDGNPMMPPIIEDDGERIQIGGMTLWRLPGGWGLAPMIQDLPYEVHLAVLNDHLKHTKQTDLPELGFGEIAESDGDRSGKALRVMLIAAISRAVEVRGNHEAALIRAQQMGCSMGRFHKLPGFVELGDYRAGQLNHRFEDRSVLPLSEDEEAAIDKLRAEAQAKKREYGYSKRLLMEQDGLSKEQIDDALAETEAPEAAGDLLNDPLDREAQDLLDAALNRGEPVNA